MNSDLIGLKNNFCSKALIDLETKVFANRD